MSNSLIENLQNPQAYDHSTDSFRVLNTHVSWVILTGGYAYKIKKPVDFGFLDYSTLEKRRFYCEEEIRLNQPFAAELYLGVVSINGTLEQPRINSTGPVLEYAVKMREFPQESLLSEVLARHELTADHIDQLAKLIAGFHQRTPVAAADSAYGTPQHVHAPVIQNFEQIATFLTEQKDREQMARLQQWSEQQFQKHKKLLEERKQQGFIRECHGDLHLKNIILFKQQPLLFDRIEFSNDFRWTDVMADVGFLAMDLDDNKQQIYARRFINQYFAHTGDYTGLALLPYYQTYRAIVRAKICLFSLSTAKDAAGQQAFWQQYRNFMALAERYTQVATPTLFITHGLAGSGKSTMARELVERLGAIQIRSDIERKRLHDLPAMAKTNSDLLGGIYHPEITQKLYEHLAELAQLILNTGYSIVVDATFLKKVQRALLQQVAEKLKIPFAILNCQASRAQLEKRLLERQHDPSEASLAVLDLLEKEMEPLTAAEQKFVVD
jgi:aminoglycoside phosphotransferase family enzyme/predicted kinase